MERRTLMDSVRIVAITSKPPPNTRLSGSDGSYSQIALVVSITASLVMWDMISTFARLMTCSRQLGHMVNRHKVLVNDPYGSWFSAADQAGSWQSPCWSSMVSQNVLFEDVLSRVTV